MHDPITPPMTAQRAQAIAADFDLRALPADFLANPYPVYAALRETEPVRRMPDGSYFLTRHADLVAAFVTGVEGLNKFGIGEMQRLNTSIAATPAGAQNNLGVLGGDNAGEHLLM